MFQYSLRRMSSFFTCSVIQLRVASYVEISVDNIFFQVDEDELYTGDVGTNN